MTKSISFIFPAPNRYNSLPNCYKPRTGMVFAFSNLHPFTRRLFLRGVFVARVLKFREFIEMLHTVKLQKMIQKGISRLFFDMGNVSWK